MLKKYIEAIKLLVFKLFSYLLSEQFFYLTCVGLYVVFLYGLCNFICFCILVVDTCPFVIKKAYLLLSIFCLGMSVFIWWVSFIRPLFIGLIHYIWISPFFCNVRKKELLLFFFSSIILLFLLFGVSFIEVATQVAHFDSIPVNILEAKKKVVCLSPTEEEPVLFKLNTSVGLKYMPHEYMSDDRLANAEIVGELPIGMFKLKLNITTIKAQTDGYLIVLPSKFVTEEMRTLLSASTNKLIGLNKGFFSILEPYVDWVYKKVRVRAFDVYLTTKTSMKTSDYCFFLMVPEPTEIPIVDFWKDRARLVGLDITKSLTQKTNDSTIGLYDSNGETLPVILSNKSWNHLVKGLEYRCNSLNLDAYPDGIPLAEFMKEINKVVPLYHQRELTLLYKNIVFSDFKYFENRELLALNTTSNPVITDTVGGDLNSPSLSNSIGLSKHSEAVEAIANVASSADIYSPASSIGGSNSSDNSLSSGLDTFGNTTFAPVEDLHTRRLTHR